MILDPLVILLCDNRLFVICYTHVCWCMVVSLQELLRAQVPVQASLQVLQELGDQLKQQVDTSAASAVQSDHLSLTQRLVTVEQALSRQLTTLQVQGEYRTRFT